MGMGFHNIGQIPKPFVNRQGLPGEGCKNRPAAQLVERFGLYGASVGEL